MLPIKLLFVFLCFLLCLQQVAWSQHERVVFKKIREHDGLLHDAVYKILEDNHGYVWFATRNGIQRFDGHTLRSVKFPEDIRVGATTFLTKIEESIAVLQSDKIYLIDPIKLQPKKIFIQLDSALVVKKFHLSSLETAPEGVLFLTGKSETFYGRIDQDTLRLNSLNERIKSHFSAGFVIKYVQQFNGKILVYTNTYIIEVPIASDGFPDFESITKHHDQLNGRIIHTYGDGTHLCILLDTKIMIYSTVDLDFSTPKRIIPLNPDYSYNSIVEDGQNHLWVTTNKGLLRIDLESRFTWLRHVSNQSNAISANQLTVCMLSSRNILWVGSLRGGVNFANVQSSGLTHFHVSNQIGQEVATRSLSVVKDHIWLGSLSGDIVRIDQDKQAILTASLGRNPVKKIMALGKDQMIAISNASNTLLDLEGKVSAPFTIVDLDHKEYLPKRIISLEPYAMDKFWISTRNYGTRLIENSKGSFREVSIGKLGSNLRKIEANIIYVDSLKNGLLLAENKHLQVISLDSMGLPTSVKKAEFPRVSQILMIHDSLYAFATLNDGIQLVPSATIWEGAQRPTIAITSEDGLIDNRINDIFLIGDQLLLNGRGTQLFNLKTHKLSNLDLNVDWSNNPIIRSSGFQYRGRIYFGLQDGLLSVDPTRLTMDIASTPCQITGIEINTGSSERKELRLKEEHDEQPKRVHLSAKDNNVRIYFTDFDYLANDKKIYHYRIKEQEEWQSTSSYWVDLSNLNPGAYTFEVCSNKIALNIDVIELNIDHPWYWTILARVFYVIIFLSMVILIVYHRHNWLRLRSVLTTNEKVYQFKSEFFSKMAHEIRTPLSLITSPLDEVIKSNQLSAAEKETLSIARKNTERLHNLADQMLHQNFDSLNYSKLKIEYLDVNSLVEDLLKMYSSDMEKKDLKINFETESETYQVWGDTYVLRTSIGNILDNAIKYSQTSGTIDIRILPNQKWSEKKKDFFTTKAVVGEYFGVQIRDYGKGISQNKIRKIFDRFFQSNVAHDDGIGIGLTVARDLVHLSQGVITVETSEQRGSRFIILLPANKEAFAKDQIVVRSSPLVDSFNQIGEVKKPTLLLVEPDLELKQYLVDQLSSENAVTSVNDCEAAFDILKFRAFDLIISEYYLPNRNGMSLCKWLREHKALKALPFILISSREIDYAKYKDTYVDRHLRKPLDIELLRVNIRSLTHKDKFRSKGQLINSALKGSIRDDERELAKQIVSLLMNNLSDASFGVDSLSKSLGISNRSLQLKMKKWFDKSPKEFITDYRLEYAADLLKSNKFKITEVVYSSGFNTPAHFSKIFKDKYGVKPSEVNTLTK